jgi:hypothetical protein
MVPAVARNIGARAKQKPLLSKGWFAFPSWWGKVGMGGKSRRAHGPSSPPSGGSREGVEEILI